MHFDNQAQTWDNDPMKVKRAEIIAEEIKNFIQPAATMRALEFGCGTGLLSFQLKDVFAEITLTDTSEGMLAVLKQKIAENKLNHFRPMLTDLTESDSNVGKHDVIFTSMALHHVYDIWQIIKTFNSLLPVNGYLCIADLVKEDGSFHSNHPDFDGHNGFELPELSKIILDSGFEILLYKICFEIEKSANELVKKYPVFLLIAKKIAE